MGLSLLQRYQLGLKVKLEARAPVLLGNSPVNEQAEDLLQEHLFSMHKPLGLTTAQRWFLSAALSPLASQGDITSWWKGGLCPPTTVRFGNHQEPGCHHPWLRGSARRSDRTRPLTLKILQTARTYSSSVMASWQLSHTLTSNSKPISGIGERLELHLPQTAFPHLRQWCWREEKTCSLRLRAAAAPGAPRGDPQPPGAEGQREGPSALEARARCLLLGLCLLGMRAV